MYGLKFATPLIALFIVGCAGLHLDEAKKTWPQGTPFERFLFVEYRDRAQNEFNEGDYKSSDFFALRAIAASAPADVTPQEVSDRALPEGAENILQNARNRLTNAKANGGADKAPKPLAKAQIAYECWLEEQEENRHQNDIRACQNTFLKNMAAVDKALAPKPMAKAEPAKPMAKEEMKEEASPPPAKPGPVKFTIYFEFDSDDLTSGAQTIIGNVVRIAKGRDNAKITLVGHADLAGGGDYNERLSARRSAAVAQGLVKAGISPKSLRTRYKGETEPAKKTDDGAKSKFNRRVTVTIE